MIDDKLKNMLRKVLPEVASWIKAVFSNSGNQNRGIEPGSLDQFIQDGEVEKEGNSQLWLLRHSALVGEKLIHIELAITVIDEEKAKKSSLILPED